VKALKTKINNIETVQKQVSPAKLNFILIIILPLLILFFINSLFNKQKDPINNYSIAKWQSTGGITNEMLRNWNIVVIEPNPEFYELKNTNTIIVKKKKEPISFMSVPLGIAIIILVAALLNSEKIILLSQNALEVIQIIHFII